MVKVMYQWVLAGYGVKNIGSDSRVALAVKYQFRGISSVNRDNHRT